MESEGRNREKRGKALVAVEEIEELEVIWKEDPWIVAPEWAIFEVAASHIQMFATLLLLVPVTNCNLTKLRSKFITRC